MAVNDDWDKALEDMKKTDAARNGSSNNGNKKRRFSRMGCGIWIGIIGFVVFLFLCIFGSGIFFGFLEGTRPIPGDASNFEPMSVFEDVQKFAGDKVQFVEMTANYVRSDGTMDLDASYYPSVEYTFVQQTNNDNNVPLGAPGYRGENAQYQYVIVEINRPMRGMSRTRGGVTTEYTDLGMSRDFRDVPASADIQFSVPPPTCSLADLWQVAKAHDAPNNAVAVVDYNVNGYHFVIRDVGIDLHFSMDCVVIVD